MESHSVQVGHMYRNLVSSVVTHTLLKLFSFGGNVIKYKVRILFVQVNTRTNK